MSLDLQLFVLLNERLHNRALDWLMPRLTNIHQSIWFWLVMAPILIRLFVQGNRRTRTILLLLVVLLPAVDFISSGVMKPIFHRPRPTAQRIVGGKVETVVAGARLPPHSQALGTSAFPSSHSAVAAALATTLILAYRRRSRLAWLALLIPLVIGYSRIYVGVHYPSDVLSGWILGALLAAATWVRLVHFHWIPTEEDLTPEPVKGVEGRMRNVEQSV